MADTMVEHMLSTVDNPYNPFTHFAEWYAFDSLHHHNTSELLARVVKSSEELSNLDQVIAVELAMDEIVEENANGLYIKVAKPKDK